MKKVIMILVSVLALTIALVGCNSKTTSNVVQKVDNSDSKVAIPNEGKKAATDKIDNTKTVEKKIDTQSDIVKYENKELGFSLDIPKSWVGRYEAVAIIDSTGVETGVEFSYLEINKENRSRTIGKDEKFAPSMFTITTNKNPTRGDVTLAAMVYDMHLLGKVGNKNFFYYRPEANQAGFNFKNGSVDYEKMVEMSNEQSAVADTFKALK